jgi:hypothetical protein
MEIKTELKRTTFVDLTENEFKEAICMYLKSKGIKDTEQHVVIDVIETGGEEGTQLQVIINNYDQDNNLFESIKKE